MRASGMRIAVIYVFTFFLPAFSVLRVPASAQAVHIENGNMETTEAGTEKLSGWTSFLWDGNGSISRSNSAAFSGRTSAVIENIGPAKQAIFQRKQLQSCAYQLTAAVASHGLEPGLWQQTTSVVIIFADQSSVTHPLLKGDNDWRELEVTFYVPTPQEVIIYFFNYGSGRLFVDEVSLTEAADCSKRQSTFALANQAKKKLSFSPPIGPEDFVMAGYCPNPAFADREFCRRLSNHPSPPANAEAREILISNFDGTNPFPLGSPIEPDVGSPGKIAKVVPGQFLAARSDLGLRQNWDGYDKLRVDVGNPSSEPQPLTISIWDDKTTGYWSRVNWYAFAPPGNSTLDVPLQIFVGEKSVVQDRRRLDLKNIRQLVFFETKVELRVSNIRLEEEPPITTRFPELIALDLGTPTSPVMKGFSPLNASQTYRASRGYGLSPGSVVARAEDRRHPDNLHRDWISFRSGGLQFDLPNGRYRVWMVLEDPGYWEYYPSWRSRSVYIQNKKVLNQEPTYDEFLSGYFRHANDEDIPGDDIWKRYVSLRYAPRGFDAVVTDGQLSIRFDGNSDPFATALSAIIIYPAERDEQGKAFMREQQQALKAQFDSEYRQIMPTVSASLQRVPNALDGKLWVFSRDTATDIYSTDTPKATELRESLAVSLGRGEIEAFTIALRPLDAQFNITRLVADIPGLKLSPYKVRNKATRLTFDGSIYMNKPRLLDPLSIDPLHPLTLPPDRSTWLWFEVEVGAETQSGIQNGSVTIEFDSGQTKVIPVSVNVLPWTLPEADIPVGYLGSAVTYPNASYPELALRREKEFEQSLDLLKRFGMTSVSGGLGPIKFSKYRDGIPIIDFGAADKSMNAMKTRFSGGVATYLGLAIEGISVDKIVETQQSHGKPYIAVARDILTTIERHSNAQSWLPLINIVGDEPTGTAVSDSIAVARVFKDANARTGVFTSFADAADPRAALAGKVDLLYVNQHTSESLKIIKERGSSCAFYNRDTRYDRGVYLFKARQAACFGHMQFAFNSVHADPWYGLDGREDEYAAVFAHPDGMLRVSLDFVRYRQAVSDYRYLLALEQAINQAPDNSNRQRARAYLNRIENAIEIGSDKPKAFNSNELDTIRENVQNHLLVLGYTGHAE